MSKVKPITPALFARSAGRPLKIQRSLLFTLALDMSLLRCTHRSSYAKLKLFIDEAQKAWHNSWRQIGCESCGEPFIRWLRGLIKESYEARLWVPGGFVKRLRQLERGELVLKCTCGQACSIPLYSDLPIEFQQCAQFMGWKWNVIPDWKGRFISLSTDGAGPEPYCSELVEWVIRVWRNRPTDDQGSESDPHQWIKDEINRSECGWKLE
jgi:hypothetical protein